MPPSLFGALGAVAGARGVGAGQDALGVAAGDLDEVGQRATGESRPVAARDKRHVQFAGGHIPPLQDVMREVLKERDGKG